jgi:dienelactone hydrolase
MAQAISGEPITIGPQGREALLGIPDGATGLVIFAHGSGSGRFSPRNNFVAAELQRANIATLLLDLLTPDEELDRSNVFDVRLLASRLAAATRWARENESTAGMSIGYFGASTGAAAALIAETEPNSDVAAIVSRGGRPDLAADALDLVRAPTLLIVGGLDAPVISLNERAFDRLQCEKDLQVVAGAGHVFEEPGALEAVSRLARAWFGRYLGSMFDEDARHVRTQPDIR